MKNGKTLKTTEFSPTKRLRKIFFISLLVVLLFIITITLFAFYLFINIGVINYEYLVTEGAWIIVIFILFGASVGYAITYGISKLILKPSWNILTGIQRLSKGDYSARIDLSGSLEVRELANNFNLLAEELERTNIMRSDFINNFSHEFKTPIVSMKGLVELLKKDNLPKKKREEYLKIIEEELDRLVNMSTNILNLSKIENQKILTDIVKFNVSEQIRTCILLLEKKWSKKNIELTLDFDEFYYRGNEDLLKQVWINLLDNAVKFSYEHGTINVNIAEDENFLHVTISDTGDAIPESELPLVFDKFYQKDKTAMAEGNGIGLSIVSHIVDLHRGTVTVQSDKNSTSFTVALKKGL